MKLKGKKIGFILTGSFCTFQKTIEQMEKIIKEEAKVIPIMSYNSYKLDTKFGKARRIYWKNREYDWAKNYSYNSRCRANRSQALNRYNDNCSM